MQDDDIREVDFEADGYDDIIDKDDRYHPHAYAFLLDVIHYLGREKGRHVNAEEIMDEFREYALDQYGPLTYSVMCEWGLKSCADIGEMMFNLVDSARMSKDDSDDYESFATGFDFEEAFLGPYR